MPTNVISADKMQVGIKGGGKHWTRAEVERRKAAAQRMQRKEPAKLICPVWLDDEARRVWKKTLKNLSDLNLLDKADEDMLATYCDAVARYKELSLKIREEGYVSTNNQGTETVSPYVKSAQSYARIMMQYAEKLGLTPNARARLAKKMAEGEDDPNADLFV